MPIAMSDVRATTAKQMEGPAARWRWVHAMNRSKPSTVAGGGEMNRATSAVVNETNSDGASRSRSSRSVTSMPVSVGSPRAPVGPGESCTPLSRCAWTGDDEEEANAEEPASARLSRPVWSSLRMTFTLHSRASE